MDEAIAACGVFGKLEIKPLVAPAKEEVSEELKESIERLVYSSKFLEIAVVTLSSSKAKSEPTNQSSLKLHPT